MRVRWGGRFPQERHKKGVSCFAGGILEAAAVALCFVWPCYTAEAGVAVSPMQQWVAVKPGEQASFSITLNNVLRSPQDKPVSLSLEVVDFAISPDGTVLFGPDYAHGRSAVSWIRLDGSEVTLKPGEIRVVHGEVTAPYTADGDYWAAVLISQGAPRADAGVTVRLRTASGVFVRVERCNYVVQPDIRKVELSLPEGGDVQGGDDAQALRAARPGGSPGACLEVIVGVANPTPVSFVASGRGSVYSADRRKVATIPLHSRRPRIMPGDMRLLAGVLSSPLPVGDYMLRLQVDTDARASRSAYCEVPFTISEEIARKWRENRRSVPEAAARVEPTEIRLTLSAGRLTGTALCISNLREGTMHVTLRQLNDTMPSGWLSLGAYEFTLGPLAQRSIYCRLEVPRNAQVGQYAATISVEVEVAGLSSEAIRQTQKIPVLLTVQ